MVDKLAGEVTITFEVKQGPRRHWYPMMLVQRGDAIAESVLGSLNGYRDKNEAEKILIHTRQIFEIMSSDEEGTEL